MLALLVTLPACREERREQKEERHPHPSLHLWPGHGDDFLKLVPPGPGHPKKPSVVCDSTSFRTPLGVPQHRVPHYLPVWSLYPRPGWVPIPSPAPYHSLWLFQGTDVSPAVP